jgi:N-acetylglucosaminyl-diphospho-decaprenol L-rhamnosyltransferase
MPPAVSVVIVNYRQGDLLLACLESVFRTADALPVEVIVVDNASGDDTATVVAGRFPRVRLVLNDRNLGFARATNQGLALGTAPLCLWLNPDTVVQPGALQELVRFFHAHPDAAAVGPRMIGPDGELQYSCRAFPTLGTGLFTRYSLLRRLWPGNPVSARYLLSGWDHAGVREVDWISGSCLLTSRDVLRRVGPLDEAYFLFNEDVDWCRRAADAGLRVYYDPAAVVVHHIGASKARLPAWLVVERHRGMFRYYRKHMRRSRWLDVPVAVGIAVRAGVELLTRSTRRPA